MKSKIGQRGSKRRARTKKSRLSSFICHLEMGKKIWLGQIVFNPCTKQSRSWCLLILAVQGICPWGCLCVGGIVLQDYLTTGVQVLLWEAVLPDAAGGLSTDTQRHTTRPHSAQLSFCSSPGLLLCDLCGSQDEQLDSLVFFLTTRTPTIVSIFLSRAVIFSFNI